MLCLSAILGRIPGTRAAWADNAEQGAHLMAIDWTMPMDPEDRARLASLRQRFTDCAARIAANGANADTLSAAVVDTVASTTTATLPPQAQFIWSDRIARPLKSDPAKPLPERAVNALRSWPASRVTDFAAALVEVEAILIEVENEALHEAIYVEISRAYS